MANILEVKDLCKTYVIDKRQNNVLRNVNFEVEEGDMVAIMGPSGSGKSTLLYSVSGMDVPTSGTVCFAGILRSCHRRSLRRCGWMRWDLSSSRCI